VPEPLLLIEICWQCGLNNVVAPVHDLVLPF